MAIDKKEFLLEKEHFEETVKWIELQIEKIDEEDKRLTSKLNELKKASRGSYSQELELYQNLYGILIKDKKKYKESKSNPYFGRIDFKEKKRYESETFYVGKFGLGDVEQGEEKVIDWRAPIADLYYSSTNGDAYYISPMGVINGELNLKRKFLIKEENLIDAFDEGNEIILKNSTGEDKGLMDEFLKINLENNVSSKLKDVVATIQKEQNDIIRRDKEGALIIQGSAGSGKTTVALHRLAYILYKFKEKILGEDVLVIAPNKLFLDYISEVLPDLGVDKVNQKTMEEVALDILNLKGKIYSKDNKLSFILENQGDLKAKYIKNSSKIKGSLLFKSMIDRYLKYIEIEHTNIEDIKVRDYVLFSKDEIKRLFVKDMSRLPIDVRKFEIKKYFKNKLNEKVSSILDKIEFSYEYFIARVKKEMDDSEERRKKLTALYEERNLKKNNIKKEAPLELETYFSNWIGEGSSELYYKLFFNKEVWDIVTMGKIPEELYDYMKQELNENIDKGIMDSDDLIPMLYMNLKIRGIDKKFKHIVIDEAQDYSLFAMSTLALISEANSFTIVGDIGQGIYFYKGINDWDKVINDCFEGNGEYKKLTQSYRSTVEIIDLANKVLKKQENNLEPAIPVLRHGKKPEIIEFNNFKSFCESLDVIVEESEKANLKSIAVIGRNLEECKKIREYIKKYSKNNFTLVKDSDKTIVLDKIIIPSYMTKGLEFDCSIVYNCNNENYKDEELDKKLLYVVLTRALHREYIFYKGEVTRLLQ